MKTIENFDGDFGFLSNFSPHKFRDDEGALWQTVEHYYQAMKTDDLVDQGRIWSATTPGRAKKIGQTVNIRNDWKDKKFEYMMDGISWKFLQNKDIMELLISTKGYYLEEGNKWHDNIWGDCKCDKCEKIPGENWLGKILMELREGFINGEYELLR